MCASGSETAVISGYRKAYMGGDMPGQQHTNMVSRLWNLLRYPRKMDRKPIKLESAITTDCVGGRNHHCIQRSLCPSFRMGKLSIHRVETHKMCNHSLLLLLRYRLGISYIRLRCDLLLYLVSRLCAPDQSSQVVCAFEVMRSVSWVLCIPQSGL